jgi:nucleoside-diphosphate-sugar epimerase
MRVFISGATGILGRRVVNLLTKNGHQVVGLSRSQANTEWLNQHGAEARQGNLFNQEEICDLCSDCNAVLHLATAIPTKSRTTLAAWRTNDLIRREGTRVMVEAALRNKCDLYVQQSVTFIYGDRNGDWVDENTPIAARQASVLQSAVDMEQIVQEAITEHDLPTVILRFGTFYSYDSAQTQTMFEMTRKGFFPLIGNGAVNWNIINVDDAATAVLKTIENYKNGLGQTFNACDDEPVTYRELLNYVAKTLGARKPIRIPLFLAKLLLGSHIVDVLLASVRCKNQLIKERLNWTPEYPTYREGYRAEIEKWVQSR